jgi:long-subunit fatty acid transport protein
VGAGLSVSESQSGLYKFGLDVPDRTVTVREEQVDATFAPAFNAGVIVQATNSLRVGATWRGAQSEYTDVPTDFELQGLGSLLIQTAGTTLYWPHTLSVGAEWRVGGLRLCGQLDAQFWSAAPSEELQFALLPTGQVLTDTGLADLLNYNAAPRPAGFHNVLVPRLGAEWVVRAVALRAGIAYRPPVTPEQSALSSYLDNTTLTLGAGGGVDLHAVWQDAPAGMFVDAALAGTLLMERSMHKASATNPTGDAYFGGSLWTFSTMVRYEY